MDVLWDPEKTKTNFRKHRIRFSDADFVFYDPMALVIEEQLVDGEQRFVSVGTDSIGRILVVVYSYRNDSIQIISARKATPRERKVYEKRI